VGVLRYTGEVWGRSQLLAYRDKIDAALQLLASNPMLGRLCDDLPSTHRLYAVGSHVIIYRVEGEGAAVVRILHQRMSIPGRI
jgi:toxin ParE1/3/4